MQPDKPDISETPEWLISYSDLMSLLLCLFVMLYALSTVQELKFQAATESLRGGFGLFGTSQSFKTGTAAKPVGKQIGGIILFDWGSEDLSEAAKQELNEIHRQLLGTPDNIQIIGQAGLGESSVYRRELDLAYARAINVWDYLVSLGIDRKRLQVVQQAGEAEGARVEIRSGR